MDVQNSLGQPRPEYRIDVDRDVANELGLTVGGVAGTVRPVLMTTLAMIAGMIPSALALGEGGGFRAPMSRAVIGGLITSTILTLLVVPVAYTYFDEAGAWIGRKLGGRKKARTVGPDATVAETAALAPVPAAR